VTGALSTDSPAASELRTPLGQTVDLAITVRAKRPVAEDVVELVVEPELGRSLPTWEPGAHVDLILPSGLVRQYSLCGEPDDEFYTLAVLRERDGRGGSREIHDTVQPGARLTLRGPRNHFPLVSAEDYLFIAGGIGITPLRPMIWHAERAGVAWRLLYGGRLASTMAYADQMRAIGGRRVTLVPEDSEGRPDLDAWLATVTASTSIYACGPSGLLDAIQQRCASLGIADRLYVERFAASGDGRVVPLAGDQAFDLELAQSGRTVRVGADQTIYEAVQEVAPDLLFSCAEGYCGTCEVRVLDGTPDHRDTIGSAEEHDDERTMMLCVSRSKTPRLVIDA
jgi:ferredoxin-NADP reductase